MAQTLSDDGSIPYTRTAQALHWLIALLVVVQVALGFYMLAIEDDPGSAWYFALHVSVGLTIAALAAIRILWRLGHAAPPLPASVPRWEVRAAYFSHKLLYLLLVLMPLTGFIGRAHSQEGLAWFGMSVPFRLLTDETMMEQWYGIHIALAWTLLALVALHVLAALKHLLIDRDGLVSRMYARRRGPR